MITFSERLGELMAEKRFNNSSLGKALGVTHSTVARWLNGSKPNSETLSALARHLGVSAHFLITGENEYTLKEEGVAYGGVSPTVYNNLLATLIPKLDAPELMETIEVLHKHKAPGWEDLSAQAITLLKKKIADHKLDP